MKFPRFIRLPQYKRFHITPRYYDPIKEDIEIRTEKIKRELENGVSTHYRSNIRGSFTRKAKYNVQSGLLRIILFLVICGVMFGYLLYGRDVLIYGLFSAGVLYIIWRLKGLLRRR
ncbi:hypothetical protein QQ008_22020 [Fulvivirgaceae bacterium BMA10]|uniref:Uncharacterized protein n=1 Tax=Splendidivirga corallicola TaxID=3051826 RepID=A0ABT8KTJ7_9BACT|nr:hypothetical protein [Fulvivirgaceae bacterium BMA10]